MAFQNPVGPQPDTQRMVQSVRIFADSFAEELAKLPNVPAIAQGNALQHTLDLILAQMTQINVRLDQVNVRLDQVNVRLDQVDVRLNALTLRISTR